MASSSSTPTEFQLAQAIRHAEDVKNLLPTILTPETVKNIGWMMEETVLHGYTESYHLLAHEVFTRAAQFYDPIRHAAMDAILHNRDDIIDDLFARISALPNPGHYEDWLYTVDENGMISDNNEVRRCDIIGSALCAAIHHGSLPAVRKVLGMDDLPVYMVGTALEAATTLHDADMAAVLVQELMREKAQVTRFIMRRSGFETVDVRVGLELRVERATHILDCLKIAEEKGFGDVVAVLLPHYLECVAGHPTCDLLQQSGFIYMFPHELYRYISRGLCKKFLNRDIPVKFRSFLYTLLEDESRKA
ncbi:hypothetical protein ASPSYDRAFT_1173291 [Aspergillus sydowii CBS 593.65]|uniref:Uncharacterized protein n=1 Tax=Aspergillus sydowii CBS 593.65 TaxID=1036612 RepID=A0A1L9TQ21_9EURO|nr:uncharacterized protein ASPSYDRAFT_1173291 [Aspergillus sydowii CBS 593.65]OJJ61512.1 hypothetical protein ASPSYDRAFT_1173291 [Aspergillus sydowii CBS 593.65]